MLRVPGLAGGRYRLTAWDTCAGAAVASTILQAAGEALVFEAPPVATDLMLALTPMETAA